VLSLTGNFTARNFDGPGGLTWAGYYGNSSGAIGLGIIDEARYWNYERTEAQINAFMKTRLPLSERSGLNGYWSFCGNYADSSGNHNDGIPKGNPQIVDITDLPPALTCGTLPPIPVIVIHGSTRLCAGTTCNCAPAQNSNHTSGPRATARSA